MTEDIPKLIFIVPYRDRKNQKGLFLRQMAYVLEDVPTAEYKIFFAHQCDTRDFNRGAMKNIGFLVMKNKYPNDYKNITFVFNDVDTMPYEKNVLNYSTTKGVVKHFFGYENTLGGIVCITGEDFENTLGYPNLWAWGFEDNMLQIRVLRNNITIDRSLFFRIANKEIIQLTDDLYKVVNRGEFDRYMSNTDDGIKDISSLDYTIDETNGIINITNFSVPVINNPDQNKIYDIRNGSRPFSIEPKSKGRRFKATMSLFM